MAAEKGFNPNLWFSHVEHAVSLVGRKTVQYMSNICKYHITCSFAAERISAGICLGEALKSSD
ncbi:MAG: hypothetical protein J0L51_03125 [Rhizobiales bacterium]|nr:hypothetical protein [Hyphomicrobiales bacterium]